MNNANLLNNINLYSLYVLAFALSFYKKALPILIILFLVTSLLSGVRKLALKDKKVLLFALLYLSYIVGLLYSTNLSFGLKDLETKLSLLVFPLAFFMTSINLKKALPAVLKWFVMGLTLASIICLTGGVYQFALTGEEAALFYSKLSLFHHPSYFSMYLNLGLLVLYFGYFKENSLVHLNTTLLVIVALFFSIIIVLLSSKIGIITMLILQFFALLYWVIKYKQIVKSLVGLAIIVGGLIVVYQTSHVFSVRINEFVSVITSDKASKKSTTGVRIYAWQTAIELIKEKPLIGYGTGDVKEVLVNEYVKKELTVLAGKELNPHNQFLQTTVAIGVVGFLLLLLSLVLPMAFSVQQKYYLYTSFLVLFLINNLTESMLETQSGVIFYGFFNALFFVAYLGSDKENSTVKP